jgi:hypothetical protein
VDLGKTYPEPIIDHREGRERALKAYAKVRASRAHTVVSLTALEIPLSLWLR